SAGAVFGGLLVAISYRDGPSPFAKRPFSWKLVGTVLADRPTRLAIGGYPGHLGGVYACWSALALFLLHHFTVQGIDAVTSATLAGLWTFAFITAGAVGSVLAGRWADRFGRENVAAASMVVSGACALTLGWIVSAPSWV